MNPRGRDNAKDRETGQRWESQFCRMARLYGKVFTPHQFGRPSESAMFFGGAADLDGKTRWTLPDITIWSAPGEHHEIKHKNRDQMGCYGLERYRLDALIRFANTTAQRVYYSIHDWEMAGASGSDEEVENNIDHWVVADVAQLARGCTRKSDDWTYYNGGQRRMETWYWTGDANPSRRLRWFRPLVEVWQSRAEAA